MISGTSFDAVEALLADLDLEGEVLACDLVEHRSVPYPPAVRRCDRGHACRRPRPRSNRSASSTSPSASSSPRWPRTLADRHGGVDAVCSHGQTVYHWVEGNGAKGTLQLGEPAWIAERTGAAVVSDVRNRDIAAGGHGAPLASLLDVLLLGSNPPVVSGSLNLGGIANVTVVGPRARTDRLRHRPSQRPDGRRRRVA